MLILSLIIFLLGIVLCIIGYTGIYKKQQENINVKIENNNIQSENNHLKKEQENIKTNLKYIEEKLQNQYDILEKEKYTSSKAYETYVELLDNYYKEEESNIEQYIKDLNEAYDKVQDEKISKINEISKELESLRATRAAAIEAQLKEKQIKENKDFYCLPIASTDLNDIKILERVKKDLNKPRILSMLIWSTYFQKPMNTLCNNVLGTGNKIGIYKITNQLNDMCYIGQSNRIAERFKEHTKCGLDIDRPQRNKLYAAMVEDGVWNFSFELLEECTKEQLDEKEKFYINLYDSCNYGYNSTTGNS